MASKKSFFTFILPIKKVYVLVFLEDSVVQSEEGIATGPSWTVYFVEPYFVWRHLFALNVLIYQTFQVYKTI